MQLATDFRKKLEGFEEVNWSPFWRLFKWFTITVNLRRKAEQQIDIDWRISGSAEGD